MRNFLASCLSACVLQGCLPDLCDFEPNYCKDSSSTATDMPTDIDTDTDADSDTDTDTDTDSDSAGDTAGDTGAVPFPRVGQLHFAFAEHHALVQGFVKVRQSDDQILYEAWPDQTADCEWCNEITLWFPLDEVWHYVEFNLEFYADLDTADTGNPPVIDTWGVVNVECDRLGMNPTITHLGFDAGDGQGELEIDLLNGITYRDNLGQMNPEFDANNNGACDDPNFDCCSMGGQALIFRQ